MQNVAQAWYVIQLTHSPLAVGVLAVCQFGPYGLFGLLGGTIADRLNQRRLLIATQIAFLLSAVLIVIALYVRLKITETPVFASQQASKEAQQKLYPTVPSAPIVELFRAQLRQVVLASGCAAGSFTLLYFITPIAASLALQATPPC